MTFRGSKRPSSATTRCCSRSRAGGRTGRRPREVGETAEIAEIAGRPLLLLQDGHCLRDHALSACALPAARIDEFGATSLFTLTRLVEAGYGVTLLPKMAVDAGLCDTARLTVRPLRALTPTRRIGLAWRRNAGCAADCRAMADFLHGSGLFA